MHGLAVQGTCENGNGSNEALAVHFNVKIHTRISLSPFTIAVLGSLLLQINRKNDHRGSVSLEKSREWGTSKEIVPACLGQTTPAHSSPNVTNIIIYDTIGH